KHGSFCFLCFLLYCRNFHCRKGEQSRSVAKRAFPRTRESLADRPRPISSHMETDKVEPRLGHAPCGEKMGSLRRADAAGLRTQPRKRTVPRVSGTSLRSVCGCTG